MIKQKREYRYQQNNYSHSHRVVANEIVSQLRWSQLFASSLETNFSPNLLQTLNVGLRSFVFTTWQMEYMERELAKHVLKKKNWSINQYLL